MTRLRVPDWSHGMKWLVACLLLLFLPARAAAPHLALEVTLDPDTRAFSVTAELTTAAGPPQLQLNPLFTVSRVTRSGAATSAATTPQHVSLAYSGTLPALPQGDQRDATGPAALFAAPEGSYLSPGAGWYPDPGVPFTYTLKLSLPAGQKGLAPGEQKSARAIRSAISAWFPARCRTAWACPA